VSYREIIPSKLDPNDKVSDFYLEGVRFESIDTNNHGVFFAVFWVPPVQRSNITLTFKNRAAYI
jgi:hypothetical protein